MVTNLIFFLYGIKIDYIRQRENEYIFFFNDDFYVFKECFDTEEKLIFLNKLNLTNNRFHILIKNRYSHFLSSFNNSFYVLMKVRIKTNRLVVLDDVLYLKQGECLVVDAEIINSENCEVDESVITGESDSIIKNS